MFLSGIYHGRNPIYKAYKNGRVIWGQTEGEWKYIDLNPIDVNAVPVAYITQSALHELQIECGININIDTTMMSDASNAMEYNVDVTSQSHSNLKMQRVINLGSIAVILLTDATAVASPSKNVQSLLDIDLSTDVNGRASVAKRASNDTSIDLNIDADAVALRTAAHVVDNHISLLDDMDARVSMTRAGTSDTHMILDGNVGGHVSEVCATTVDVATNFETDAFVITSPTIDTNGYQEIVIDSDANMRFSRTARHNVNDNMVISSCVEQNMSSSSDVYAEQSLYVDSFVETNISQLSDVVVNQSVSVGAESELNMAIFSYNSVSHQLSAVSSAEIISSYTKGNVLDASVDIDPKVITHISDTHDGILNNDFELNCVVDVNTSKAMKAVLEDNINSNTDVGMCASDYFTFNAHNDVCIREHTDVQCADPYTFSLQYYIESNSDSTLSNGALHLIDETAIQCYLGYSVELILELGWDNPVKIGNSLLITQVYDVVPNENTLTLI
jgi:hypothetical protein